MTTATKGPCIRVNSFPFLESILSQRSKTPKPITATIVGPV